MSYQNAADVLPQELIERIQAYVDGGYLYVPRKTGCRRAWGEKDGRKQATRARNREIYQRSLAGETAGQLAQAYFLSPKSIQKIIARCRAEQAAE